MRGFYSLSSPRIWRGQGRLSPERAGVDPYAPDQPGHRERSREFATEIAPGMVLVSIGAPVARGSTETQPVPVAGPEEPELLPPAPVGPEAAAKDLLSVLRGTTLPDFKPGLGKG